MIIPKMRNLDGERASILNRWLGETGELWVDVHRPHSGGAGDEYFVRGVADIQGIIDGERNVELELSIFRERQYPLRGMADGRLLAQAMAMIPEGTEFHAVAIGVCFPEQCAGRGGGNIWTDLREVFTDYPGEMIGLGFNPFDSDHAWIANAPDRVMVLKLVRVRGRDGYIDRPVGFRLS